MKRFLAPFAAVVICFSPVAARAADVPYRIFVDGRPVDDATPSGISHRGVVYMNVVRAVKTFDGLLTYGADGAVRVTIGGQTLDFRVGSTVARATGARIRLAGAPFVLNGDTYVPLSAIAMLATVKMSVDLRHKRAMLTSAPPPPPTPTPVPTQASDEIEPSPAQALAIVTTGRTDAAGLHARADITNTTGRPYTITFAGANAVEFIVARDGSEIWNSLGGAAAAGAPMTMVLPPHGSQTVTADWGGMAKAGPGRYTLRVRVLTTVPLDESPVSLGVVTPIPGASG
jgi:hypothetical protein